MFQHQQISLPARLLPGVIAAVEAAGALIRAEANRPGGPRRRGSKAPVDDEAEELLRERLLALHPCAFLGEEQVPRPAIGTTDIWVVDPQDGTRDFLAGRRGSAVSVALLRNGKPVLGVVHAPTAPDDGGDLIAWAEGAALTRNRRPVAASAAGRVLALNADAGDYAAANEVALPGWRVRALPSPAYRLALAAVGEVDAGASFIGGLAPWDIAGGHALLIGAGGVVTELSGRPVDYGRSSFSGVIGGRPEAVAALSGRLQAGGVAKKRYPARPRANIGDADRLSRAQGCLLGQLAGDALGSAVEFRSAADIARSHPGGVRDLVDGGTWGLIAGQPTDDSEMALALARSLVGDEGFDPDAVAKAYVNWRASGPFDIGGTTATGIAALVAGGRPGASTSQSNGALMRVSPIGIFAVGDPDRAAALGREDAALTHPHPVCVEAGAAYAAAIAIGIGGADAAAMRHCALAVLGTGPAAEAVRARIDAAEREAPAEFQHQMGWVLTALQNAFHHLLSGTPLERAVIATVGQGGDTDTNAAICGALLGAVQGREAVPSRWRRAILTCRPTSATASRHPRPAHYWPDDALELAEALLAAEA